MIAFLQQFVINAINHFRKEVVFIVPAIATLVIFVVSLTCTFSSDGSCKQKLLREDMLHKSATQGTMIKVKMPGHKNYKYFLASTYKTFLLSSVKPGVVSCNQWRLNAIIDAVVSFVS